jgi:FMN reductase
MNILGISGSPSPRSRSAWLLGLACERLAGTAHHVHAVAVRDLPGAPLLAADAADPALRRSIEQLAQADVVVVATPIYKAAYSGLLKLYLDLLPADALRGKPVLAALGARHILDSVYVTDAQIQPHETLGFVAHDTVLERLDRALQDLHGPHAARAGAAPQAHTGRAEPLLRAAA